MSLWFRRKPKWLINVETTPDIKIASTFKGYHTLLTKRLDYLQKMFQNFKMRLLALLNKHREYFQIQQWRFGLFNFSLNIPAANIFKEVWCQLCRTFGNIQNCRPTQLPTYGYRKTTNERTVQIWEAKTSHLNTDNGNVRTLSELKKVMNLGLTIWNGPL